ncbi:MAG: hypothetical protein ACPGXL_10155 [Chitinophagales bacterium]
MEKIDLIYIGGSGHCGSTLIDLIIGSSDEVFSTGELGFYNIYRDKLSYNKKDPKFICTCKKEFEDCEFWNAVGEGQNFNIKKQYTFWENVSITLRILFPFLGTNAAKFQDDSYDLLKQIKATSKENGQSINYILDSSKDPRRLFYLLNDERIRVHPIFLVRDGRAIGHSYNKANRIPLGLKRKNYYITLLLRWGLVNRLVVQLLKRNNRHLMIKYEDFCQDTSAFIGKMNDFFGITIAPDTFLDRLNNKTYHNIDGNGFRFKRIESIHFDKEWVKKISPLRNTFAKCLMLFTPKNWWSK